MCRGLGGSENVSCIPIVGWTVTLVLTHLLNCYVWLLVPHPGKPPQRIPMVRARLVAEGLYVEFNGFVFAYRANQGSSQRISAVDKLGEGRTRQA